MSNIFDLVEILGDDFHSEELVGQMQKVDPKKSGSLDHFAFVRWYVDNEVSMFSAY